MAILDLIVGGFVGTIIMSMMIVYGYMMKIMLKDWSLMTDGLGQKMNDMIGTPVVMGWVVAS